MSPQHDPPPDDGSVLDAVLRGLDPDQREAVTAPAGVIVVRAGALQSVEVPTRGLSKHDVKALAATFGRGDVVSFPVMTGAKVRLSDRSELRVLWTPVRL